MDSRAVTIVAVAAVAAASLASGSAAASTGAVAASPGSHVWHAAIEVPGTATLNQGGGAEITSVSCASPGNCSAGGDYLDSSDHRQVFVASQVNGTWHAAIEVPGTAALNQGGLARVFEVSCASAGNCSAGGFYEDNLGSNQAFVVSQVNGTWHKAIEVPGTAVLNQGGTAGIASMSCASPGNCSAGGDYADSLDTFQAFVVSQVNGTWHAAIEVPGTAALNRGGSAQVGSVSCAAAGGCSAGGFYTDGKGGEQAFVVSQAHGAWRTAVEVPGTAALNRGGSAQISSVSCASPGNCSAGGGFADTSGFQVFVVSQVGGTWHTAVEVPGTAALNRGGEAGIGVSCAAAGNCSGGGFYRDTPNTFQAFVVSQVNGAWHTAVEVPGTAALNQGKSASTGSVSCAAAGNCSAAGGYVDGSGHPQVFVVSQVNGAWHTAVEVPGTAALNRDGNAQIGALSCAAVGNCSAGGSYTDGSGRQQAFVVSQT